MSHRPDFNYIDHFFELLYQELQREIVPLWNYRHPRKVRRRSFSDRYARDVKALRPEHSRDPVEHSALVLNDRVDNLGRLLSLLVHNYFLAAGVCWYL